MVYSPYFSLLMQHSFLISCQNNPTEVTYPTSQKKSLWWTLTSIRKSLDNYRWLEDDYAPNTKSWVVKQNETTFSYLDNIPFRRDTQANAWSSSGTTKKYQRPLKKETTPTFYKNDGLQNQYVVYRDKEGGIFTRSLFRSQQLLPKTELLSLVGA